MSDTKKCRNCGKNVASNLDFCPYCGEMLLEPIKDRREPCPYRYKEPVCVTDVLLGIALTLCLSYIGFLIAVWGFRDREDIKKGAVGTVIVLTLGYLLILIIFFILKANGVFR